MSRPSFFRRPRILYGVFSKTYQALREVLAAKAGNPAEAQAKFKVISKAWGQAMLELCDITVTIEADSAPLCTEPCLFVSNHISYMDIPAVLSQFPAVFVAKKEVKSWMAIGPAADAIGTVFVDRNSAQSKKLVTETLGHAIGDESKSVFLFPEGTSSPYGKPWKRGAFTVAKEYGFKVQPIRIAYNPHRISAYWGKDVFVFHLWRLMGRGKITASIKLFPAESIQDIDADCHRLERMIVRSLEDKLKEQGEAIDESARHDPF